MISAAMNSDFLAVLTNLALRQIIKAIPIAIRTKAPLPDKTAMFGILPSSFWASVTVSEIKKSPGLWNKYILKAQDRYRLSLLF